MIFSLETNTCGDCPMEEKIYQCCYRDPETGGNSPLVLDNGKTVLACPFLSGKGLCIRYRERPGGCRDFICDRYRTSTAFHNHSIYHSITGDDS